MTQAALIVIDMLNDFVDENGALFCGPDAQAIIPFVRERLAAHRQAGNPIIFLQDAHAEDDLEFNKFPKHCVAGTWGSRIIEDLAPRAGETVMPKTRYSGFYGTDLDKFITTHDPEEVEVVGVCTSICVMDTVGGLVNRDFSVIVPKNGVADFDADAHKNALLRMERIYGAIVR